MSDDKRVCVELADGEVTVERDIPAGGTTFRVRFRPVSPVEYRTYQRIRGGEPRDQLQAEYDLAARLIQDWQLADANGQKLAINAVTMSRLRPPLFSDLFAVVVYDTGATILGNSAAS